MRPPAPALVGVLAVVLLVTGLVVARRDEAAGTVPSALVALGDSVPAGAACDCTAFPALVARGLVPAAPVEDFARDGLTTAGLADQLGEGPTRRALRTARAVVVTVGANDLDESRADDERCTDPDACFADDLAALGPRLRAVLAQVRALVPATAPVAVTGYWNVFRAGSVAADHGSGYVAASTALTGRVDALVSAAAGATGARYVELRPLFPPDVVDGLLAPDGDHPSAAGHRVIAQAVLRVLGPVPPGPGHRPTAEPSSGGPGR